MTVKLIDPDAVTKLRAVIDAGKLRAHEWQDGTGAVCMMGAWVLGAECVNDCVTAGWDEWLVKLNIRLFDARVDDENEEAAYVQFALAIAQAVSVPHNYDRARDLFLLARLDTGEHSALSTLRSLPGDVTAQVAIVERVIGLLHRRLAGENVAREMSEVKEVAWNYTWDDKNPGANDAVVAAAEAAVNAVANVAGATADAAFNASVGFMKATRATGKTARAAANAAARRDLIAALNAA